MRLALISALLLFSATALPAAPAAGRSFALRASRIHTGEEEIADGTVLVIDGKIAAVGREVEVPAGIPRIDLPGRSVLPGLIDAETTLAEGGQDTRRSVTPEVLAADGWDFYSDRRTLLAGGVTTIYVTPGAGRLLPGRGLVVKTGGNEEDVMRRVLRRSAGVRVTLGERPKFPPSIYEPPVPPSPDRPFEPVDLQLPSSRAGQFLVLRDLLRRSRSLSEALHAPSPASFRAARLAADPEAAALLEVIAGKERLRIQVDRAHDIHRALALAGEMRIGVVLEGAREGWRVAELIRKAGAPVIFRGEAHPGRVRDEDITRPSAAGLHREGAPAVLARAGIPLAIDSPTDAEVEDLLLEAAAAVREGLSPAAALRAITLTAAEVLGVADRVGSIAPGKDADLVIVPGERLFGPESGAPLEPEAVYIDGEAVHVSGPREIPPDAVVVRCGRILTGNAEIAGGIVVVRNGKIHHVGPGAILPALPATVKVIDASGETVIPGMIDSGSRVGVRLDVLAPFPPDDATGGAGGGRSTYRIADALDLSDPAIALLLRRGITTAVISPDPAGTISGQLTALKLSGGPRSEVVLRANAGILFGGLRPEELQRAREYHDRWTAHEKALAEGKTTEAPAVEEAQEPLRPLFQGKAPAVVLARSKGDLGRLLAELSDKHRFPVAVFGLADLDEGALDELRRRSASILIGPELVTRRAPPLPPLILPRLAAEAGVRAALRSGAGVGGRHLPVEAAYAVREGWDEREALRALTVHPARIFGIDGRVGSIEKGKDADLVFLTGGPFAVSSRVMRVMVDGKVVHEEAAP